MSAGDRVLLGAWRFPSGNSVDVFLEPGAGTLRAVTLQWESPPPLRAADLRFYDLVVLPKVTRLLGEYLEKSGPAFVAQLGEGAGR